MKICLITGSTLGSAEYVAEHLQDILNAQGFDTRLEHGASYDDVADETCWLIVTSTHGAGEIPDNLQPLFNELEEKVQNLSSLRFGIVGLGNSDYDTFCYAVDHIQRILQAKSAVEICAPLKIDMPNVDDPDDAAEQWLPNFVAGL